MGRNQAHLVVTEETKRLIVDDCIKEFRKNNPEFDKVKITHDFICQRIAKIYLKI